MSKHRIRLSQASRGPFEACGVGLQRLPPTLLRGGAKRLAIPLFALLAAAGAHTHANEALATKHGCLGCHAVATKLVGPAYQAVAEKYAGQPDAATKLVASIRQGGTGKWGELAMPPQPAVSEADAKRLAAWILRSTK